MVITSLMLSVCNECWTVADHCFIQPLFPLRAELVILAIGSLNRLHVIMTLQRVGNPESLSTNGAIDGATMYRQIDMIGCRRAAL